MKWFKKRTTNSSIQSHVNESTTTSGYTDQPTTIRVNDITVANGLKCRFCGVIRPYSRPNCFCESSKEYRENGNTI